MIGGTWLFLIEAVLLTDSELGLLPQLPSLWLPKIIYHLCSWPMEVTKQLQYWLAAWKQLILMVSTYNLCTHTTWESACEFCLKNLINTLIALKIIIYIISNNYTKPVKPTHFEKLPQTGRLLYLSVREYHSSWGLLIHYC